MKFFFVAAGLLAALNSSLVGLSNLLAVFRHTSEPAGLVVWGAALFLVAAGIKRRPVEAEELTEGSTTRRISLETVFPRVAAIEAPERGL